MHADIQRPLAQRWTIPSHKQHIPHGNLLKLGPLEPKRDPLCQQGHQDGWSSRDELRDGSDCRVDIVVGVVRAEGGVKEVGGEREEDALEVVRVSGREMGQEVDVERDDVWILGGPAEPLWRRGVWRENVRGRGERMYHIR